MNKQISSQEKLASYSDFPKSYGEGILLAFSGLDGPTDYYSQTVGTTVQPSHGPGIMVFLPDVFTLLMPTSIYWQKYTADIVFNDVMCFTIEGQSAAFLAYSTDVIAGYVPQIPNISIFPQGNRQELELLERTDTQIHHKSDDRHYVLVRQKDGHHIRFAFTWSTGSSGSSSAFAKAHQAVQSDLESLIRQRVESYRKYQLAKVSKEVNHTYLKAVSILKSTIHSPNQLSPYYWMTPDRVPHRMMWIWDTVFQMIGAAKLCPDKLPDFIRSVFYYQKPDGDIPHQMGPDYPHYINIQPPILGWGTWLAYEHTRDIDFLKFGYESNLRFLKWIIGNRMNHGGLLGWFINVNPWCRCGESGMDNSPRFDHFDHLDCVDLCCYMAHDIDIMNKIAKELKCPEDDELLKFKETIKCFVQNHLWSEQEGFFYDRDPKTGSLTNIPACTGFLPLWAGLATEDQAKKLLSHLKNTNEFWTPLPLPTVAVNHPSCNRDYWRGAVWLNMTYMVVKGLKQYEYIDDAAEMVKRTIDAVVSTHQKTGAIYECYDPFNQVLPQHLPLWHHDLYSLQSLTLHGPIRNYGWSASVVIEWIKDYYDKK